MTVRINTTELYDIQKPEVERKGTERFPVRIWSADEQLCAIDELSDDTTNVQPHAPKDDGRIPED